MPASEYRIFSPDEFRNYCNNTRFNRDIRFIQNHHTLSPDYGEFRRQGDEMVSLNAMRDFHMRVRGWSDIGQNLTTFPNGKIGLCRPIDVTPAGIHGANTGGICIENLGNFDAGRDQMTQEQQDTIIHLNAVLCVKFHLSANKTDIVYHHWFDQKGQRFSDDKINQNQVGPNEQKTCPGTAFFGTNTIDSAEANFYPLIKTKMDQIGQAPADVPNLRQVTAVNGLNVRTGPGTGFPAIKNLPLDTKVTVFFTTDGWGKISATEDKWVSTTYLR